MAPLARKWQQSKGEHVSCDVSAAEAAMGALKQLCPLSPFPAGLWFSPALSLMMMTMMMMMPQLFSGHLHMAAHYSVCGIYAPVLWMEFNTGLR